MTASCRFDGGVEMRYDVLIFDSDNFLDVNDPDTDAISVNGLTQAEMETICRIIWQHDLNVCLFPCKE